MNWSGFWGTLAFLSFAAATFCAIHMAIRHYRERDWNAATTIYYIIGSVCAAFAVLNWGMS